MQQMEILDYVNEQPRRQKYSGDGNQRERRRCQLIFLCFGILCIIQAILNVSLRLALYSSKESTHSNRNMTHFSEQNQEEGPDCERRSNDQCNRLQERFNALTRDKNLLENRNNELLNMLQVCESRSNDQCNRLQERFNALTRDKNLLENRNNELLNMLKKVEEERDRLKLNLRNEKQSA